MLLTVTLGALLVSTLVLAKLSGRDATPLSADAIDSYIPYAELSRAAYCLGDLATWDCGDFVGYSTSLSTIIVAHGGIDAEELFTALESAEVAQAPLNVSLFPGVGDDVQVHAGFLNAHAKTAEAVLAAVQDTISGTGAAVLTTVGHGLGGALAEINAVYLRLNVPFIRMNTITFGKPRVGNGAWADLMDANADSYARINNMKGRSSIYHGAEFARAEQYEHPTGEIHVVEEDVWMTCADASCREDEEDAECMIQTVPDASQGELGDNAGPYGGVFIGSGYC
uniref:Fungal lipase-type domain-containing protein n=1 Tax=Schizophyllum commune (strain H4-8 / FGSC 9210) TaxID=578458 RepID=D8PUP1_SCHCM